MKERILLALGTVLCILLVIFSVYNGIARTIGVIMLVVVWAVFDNLFIDVFKKEANKQ